MAMKVNERKINGNEDTEQAFPVKSTDLPNWLT